MTATLFRAWLERFDADTRKEGRHVLLLLDNASPHRAHGETTNTKVHFLSSNTTAHLQPQVAGIIQALKTHLRKLRNNAVVDRLDAILDSEKRF